MLLQSYARVPLQATDHGSTVHVGPLVRTYGAAALTTHAQLSSNEVRSKVAIQTF